MSAPHSTLTSGQEPAILSSSIKSSSTVSGVCDYLTSYAGCPKLQCLISKFHKLFVSTLAELFDAVVLILSSTWPLRRDNFAPHIPPLLQDLRPRSFTALRCSPHLSDSPPFVTRFPRPSSQPLRTFYAYVPILFSSTQVRYRSKQYLVPCLYREGAIDGYDYVYV